MSTRGEPPGPGNYDFFSAEGVTQITSGIKFSDLLQVIEMLSSYLVNPFVALVLMMLTIAILLVLT